MVTNNGKYVISVHRKSYIYMKITVGRNMSYYADYLEKYIPNNLKYMNTSVHKQPTSYLLCFVIDSI